MAHDYTAKSVDAYLDRAEMCHMRSTTKRNRKAFVINQKGVLTMRVHAIQTGVVAVKSRQRQGEGTGFRRRLNTLTDQTWTDWLHIYCCIWAITCFGFAS